MIQEWFGLLRKDILGALPEINTGWIALLSGLFGAVITAIFNLKKARKMIFLKLETLESLVK